MDPMRGRAVIVLLLVVPLLAPGSVEASARKNTKRVPFGVWGGEHIRMDVTRGGAEIEFDCARGQLLAPLVLDRNGSFRQKGIYKADAAAPAKQGSSRWNAIYVGTLSGTRLHLELSVSGVEGRRAFDLDYGQPGSLSKCALPPALLSMAAANGPRDLGAIDPSGLVVRSRRSTEVVPFPSR